MVSLQLTPKVASKGGLLQALPVVDETIFVDANGVWFEAPNLGAWGNIPNGNFYVVRFGWNYSGSSGMLKQFKITDSNGNTLYTTPTTTSGGGTVTSPILQNTSGATLTNLRAFILHNSGTPNKTFTVLEDTLSYIHAESKNTADITGITWQIDKIHLWGTTEEVLGAAGEGVGDYVTFKTFNIDSLIKSLIWSANSGDMLFSWEGQKVGIIA